MLYWSLLSSTVLLLFSFSETKMTEKRICNLRFCFGFSNCFAMDRVGLGGGLALFWKDGVDMSLLIYSEGHIGVRVLEVGGGLS